MITTIYVYDDPSLAPQPTVGDGYIDKDVYWPEVSDDGLPVSSRRLAEMMIDMPTGITIHTTSRYVIEYYLHRVYDREIHPNDIVLMPPTGRGDDQRIRIDSDGNMIDVWPGSYFSELADLMFG